MARVFGASAALALVASCAPPLPWSGYQLYTVSSPSADDWPPGNGGFDERLAPVMPAAPLYPRIYTLPDQAPLARPANPPRIPNPDNPSPDAIGDDSGSSNPPASTGSGSDTPQPTPVTKAPALSPDQHADSSPAPAPPMIDANPPGTRCGWWRLCNLWD